MSTEFLGIGLYTISEASSLTNVSHARIRRWLKGYAYKVKGGIHTSPRVWQGQLPALNHEIALGFLDLNEVRFVNAFLNHGVSWKAIRSAAQTATRLFDTSHPFSTKRFVTDGRHIFAPILQGESRESALLDLVDSQYAFRTFLAPYLETVEYVGPEPARWWPLGRRRPVVIDPQRSFGQPILAKEGVPTRVLARAFKAEQSLSKVARWFNVPITGVKAAVEFEMKPAA